MLFGPPIAVRAGAGAHGLQLCGGLHAEKGSFPPAAQWRSCAAPLCKRLADGGRPHAVRVLPGLCFPAEGQAGAVLTLVLGPSDGACRTPPRKQTAKQVPCTSHLLLINPFVLVNPSDLISQCEAVRNSVTTAALATSPASCPGTCVIVLCSADDASVRVTKLSRSRHLDVQTAAPPRVCERLCEPTLRTWH